MDYRILDREFRDYSSELKYPFADNAVMAGLSGIAVTSGAFLDMMVTAASPASMPFYVGTISRAGESDTATMTVRDASGTIIASGIVSTGSDSADLSFRGLPAGVVVYDPAEMGKLIAASKGSDLDFGNNLPLMAGRCFVYDPPCLQGIAPGSSLGSEEALGGAVYLVAAGGVHFEEDPSDPGTYLVHLLGEEPPANRPVRSINGISRDHLWFAAHPNSSVKIETVPNGMRLRSIVDE